MKQRTFQIVNVSKQRLGALTHKLRRISITAMLAAVCLLLVAVGSVGSMSALLQKDSSHQDSNTTKDAQTIPSNVEGETPGDRNNMHTTPPPNNEDTSSSYSEETTNHSSTTVSVNGQSVTVPEGESYQRSYTTESDDGNTHVDISIESHSSSDSSEQDDSVRSRVRERTHLNVRTDSSSSTSSDIYSR